MNVTHAEPYDRILYIYRGGLHIVHRVHKSDHGQYAGRHAQVGALRYNLAGLPVLRVQQWAQRNGRVAGILARNVCGAYGELYFHSAGRT
jgi:hypothetical protein